jgi:hypothetical protein
MAQQGKQTRVRARDGIEYHSVKLVLLADCTSSEVDSNKGFSSDEAFHLFRIMPCTNSDLSI